LIKAAYLGRPDLVKWLLGFDEVKGIIDEKDDEGFLATPLEAPRGQK
jgi:hypothetical protein